MNSLLRKIAEAAALIAVGGLLLGMLALAWACALSGLQWYRLPHSAFRIPRSHFE